MAKTKTAKIVASAELTPAEPRVLEPIDAYNLSFEDDQGDSVYREDLTPANIEFLVEQLREDLLNYIS